MTMSAPTNLAQTSAARDQVTGIWANDQDGLQAPVIIVIQKCLYLPGKYGSLNDDH
jgi:hypothetical protein